MQNDISRPKSPKVALSRPKSPKVALSRLKSPYVAQSRLKSPLLCNAIKAKIPLYIAQKGYLTILKQYFSEEEGGAL